MQERDRRHHHEAKDYEQRLDEYLTEEETIELDNDTADTIAELKQVLALKKRLAKA